MTLSKRDSRATPATRSTSRPHSISKLGQLALDVELAPGRRASLDASRISTERTKMPRMPTARPHGRATFI